MKDVIQEIKNLDITHGQAVLATVIKVEGSAYRREGAKMIFTQDGTQIGTLSGGCLESDLVHKVFDVLRTGVPHVYTYDTTADDDLIWGLGSGCNGKVEILAEPVSWNQKQPAMDEPYWPLLERLSANRTSVIAVRRLDQVIPGPSLLCTSDGEIYGSIDNSDHHLFAVRLCNELLNQKQKKPLVAEKEDIAYFFDYYEPKIRLYVFGAGVDAEPVVRLADSAGFETTVIDPRPARCNTEHFAASDHLLLAHPDKALETIQITSDDFVVIMNHNFQRDQSILARMIRQKPYYLGVLGPKRRTAKLLGTDQVPENIHSPIGLSIGAKGPEEIAISIVAELIAIRSQRKRER